MSDTVIPGDDISLEIERLAEKRLAFLMDRGGVDAPETCWRADVQLGTTFDDNTYDRLGN